MTSRPWTALACTLSLACLVACPDSSATEDGDSSTDDEVGSDTSDTSDTTGETTDTSTESTTDTAAESGGEDPNLEAEDFECILGWPKVRAFRVTNVLGELDATLAVAESLEGGTYPVGSLLQLVPSEAMVKRSPGFSAETNDWEFFSLEVNDQGTQILDRGTTDVINAFGGNCLDCHTKAAPQWDLICEQDHGCDPLPLSAEQIEAIQNSDPRCR